MSCSSDKHIPRRNVVLFQKTKLAFIDNSCFWFWIETDNEIKPLYLFVVVFLFFLTEPAVIYSTQSLLVTCDCLSQEQDKLITVAWWRLKKSLVQFHFRSVCFFLVSFCLLLAYCHSFFYVYRFPKADMFSSIDFHKYFLYSYNYWVTILLATQTTCPATHFCAASHMLGTTVLNILQCKSEAAFPNNAELNRAVLLDENKACLFINYHWQLVNDSGINTACIPRQLVLQWCLLHALVADRSQQGWRGSME